MITITNDIDTMNGRYLEVGSVGFNVPFDYTNEQVIKQIREHFERKLKEQRDFDKLVLGRKDVLRLSGTTIEII